MAFFIYAVCSKEEGGHSSVLVRGRVSSWHSSQLIVLILTKGSESSYLPMLSLHRGLDVCFDRILKNGCLEVEGGNWLSGIVRILEFL